MAAIQHRAEQTVVAQIGVVGLVDQKRVRLRVDQVIDRGGILDFQLASNDGKMSTTA
jgi:hypothetical protein